MMLRRTVRKALRCRASDIDAMTTLWSTSRGHAPVASAVGSDVAASLQEVLVPEGAVRGHVSATSTAVEDALRVLTKSTGQSWLNSRANCMKDPPGFEGLFDPFISHSRRCMRMFSSYRLNQLYGPSGGYCRNPGVFRTLASTSSSQTERSNREQSRKDLTTSEDPFEAPTYNIPEKPVTFAEGASYSFIILLGLGIAAAAGYAVFKELIFEPKEYKIFGKALERVQNDSQVRVRIGSPVTGYGQESRNRAARQRIPHKTWTDESGVEHVEVNFYIRGPHGAGKVYSEMFKDSLDKQWKFTYLIVDIMAPSQARLMLESYIPA